MRDEAVLTPQVLQGKDALTKITNACDDQLGLDNGTSLSVVRYLIANRRWQVDMNERIQPSQKLTLLSAAATETCQEVGGVG